MKRFRMNRTLVRAVTLSAGLAAVTWLAQGCALLPKEQVQQVPTLAQPPESHLTTYTVSRGPISLEVRGVGRVAATQEQDLYFTRDGRIKTLNVQTGDRVKKGQVLAQLDISDLQFQYDQAQLSLKQTQLQIERKETLAKINGTLTDYDKQVDALDLKKTQMNTDRLKDMIDASTIIAPFDGIIKSVKGQVGNSIGDYDTLISIADPTKLEVQMDVNNVQQLGQIAPGQKAQVQVANGQWVDATVYQVPSPTDELSPGVPDRRVHIRLDAPAAVQFDDLLETKIIVRHKEDALLLPKAAVRSFMGRTYVRVLDGDSRREQDVELGIEGAVNDEIVQGLKEGDVVIGQ
ncbi:MAG TPA: efflux RND transporter periplasmic adaptor subunit [Limnochordia bacterium]|nr:efflux RND transporter periplasmic adaptor subunit [Limnochordia bacterium]